MRALILIACFVALVAADCYMQNPRGSNDRNNEANTNRDNANRLFDSQNNAKGGYCRGPAMDFYAGSNLQIDWTVQHGCGRSYVSMCNMVVQYMCQTSDADDYHRIRDGTTTTTIPDTAAGPTAKDGSGNYLYGMHEPYEHYQACKNRDRNKGLFIADRRNQGGLGENRRSSIYTRQNNNGNRHGYECTEERDYYPHWAPSPWHDLAILTQNADWCDFYETESQNVKDRFYCKKPETDDTDDQEANTIVARYINEAECTSKGYEWVSWPSWDEDKPKCAVAPFTRDNHLGNGFGGFESGVNITWPTRILVNPEDPESDCVATGKCECVLRIRYNISTADVSSDSASNPEEFHNPIAGFADYTKNEPYSPIKQNPTVTQDGNPVKLAIDTSQFGRTFQDRTHMFRILPRPVGIPSTTRIHNLNVAGKRGNIVQAYPATEYKFAPQFLFVAQGDYIHFQWTGCDTNPAGNAGEGTAGTDRANIMQMKQLADSYPVTDDWISTNPDKLLFRDVETRKYFTYLGQTGCLPDSQLTNGDQDVNNCKKLNAASQRFDAGLIKMNHTGEFFYMASRNNNFSNRGHKGIITVNSFIPDWAVGLVVAGAALFLGASVIGGMILYAKSNPHSGAAHLISKL